MGKAMGNPMGVSEVMFDYQRGYTRNIS